MLFNLLTFVAATFLCVYVLRKFLQFRTRRKLAAKALHDDLYDMAEDIASVSRIALALATGAAFLAAPAGLLAVAAALGLAPRPLIVVALPAFAVFATVSAAIAAALKLYAKSKKNGVAATLKSEPHKKPMSVEEP